MYINVDLTVFWLALVILVGCLIVGMIQHRYNVTAFMLA